jgi:hypothetical protein
MIDLQTTAPAPKKRTKAVQCELTPIRSGRFVSAAYGIWPGTSQLDPDTVLIEHLHSPNFDATDDFTMAHWLIGETATRFPAQAPAPAPKDVEAELRDLCAQVLDAWSMVGAHQASMRRAGAHPIFQIIRQIAPIAVEMMIERLRGEPNPLWIWALGELTGEDPARGLTTIPDAAAAWVLWADARSLG